MGLDLLLKAVDSASGGTAVKYLKYENGRISLCSKYDESLLYSERKITSYNVLYTSSECSVIEQMHNLFKHYKEEDIRYIICVDLPNGNHMEYMLSCYECKGLLYNSLYYFHTFYNGDTYIPEKTREGYLNIIKDIVGLAEDRVGDGTKEDFYNMLDNYYFDNISRVHNILFNKSSTIRFNYNDMEGQLEVSYLMDTARFVPVYIMDISKDLAKALLYDLRDISSAKKSFADKPYGRYVITAEYDSYKGNELMVLTIDNAGEKVYLKFSNVNLYSNIELGITAVLESMD